MDPLLYQIGWGFLGGVIAYLGFQGILSIKCLRLQGQLNALQAIVLQVRNSGYASKRWKAADDFEAEVTAMSAGKNQPRSRFDNDPLPYDGR